MGLTRGGCDADARGRLGRIGETAAEQALRSKGITVLERRFRLRSGEIDLIAEQGDLLIFVEVKTRRGTGYGRPAESVTWPTRVEPASR